MFDNIGYKIKSLAKLLCWIGIAVSLGSGCYIFRTNEWLGILIIVGGTLLSWLGNFILYGFGELVDNSEIANQELADIINSVHEIEDKLNNN